MSEADEALVMRSRGGDRAAFEELVRRTARLLFARAYLETGDSHRAEDLVLRQVGGREDIVRAGAAGRGLDQGPRVAGRSGRIGGHEPREQTGPSGVRTAPCG